MEAEVEVQAAEQESSLSEGMGTVPVGAAARVRAWLELMLASR